MRRIEKMAQITGANEFKLWLYIHLEVEKREGYGANIRNSSVEIRMEDGIRMGMGRSAYYDIIRSWKAMNWIQEQGNGRYKLVGEVWGESIIKEEVSR